MTTPESKNTERTDGILLPPETREGFEVTEKGEFMLPLANWEFPDHFMMYSFNMYFPKETQLDPLIPDGIVMKLGDGSQALSMHILGYHESWNQANEFLHNAREKGIKKIEVKFERRFYTAEGGKVRDLGYYLRGLSVADKTISLPESLAKTTGDSVGGIISNSSN